VTGAREEERGGTFKRSRIRDWGTDIIICGIEERKIRGFEHFHGTLLIDAIKIYTVGSGYNDVSHNDIPFITISSRAFDYFWCNLTIFAL